MLKSNIFEALLLYSLQLSHLKDALFQLKYRGRIRGDSHAYNGHLLDV